MMTIYDAFKMQVEARPDALAVMDEQKTLTYAQLDALATMTADGFPREATCQSWCSDVALGADDS